MCSGQGDFKRDQGAAYCDVCGEIGAAAVDQYNRHVIFDNNNKIVISL